MNGLSFCAWVRWLPWVGSVGVLLVLGACASPTSEGDLDYRTRKEVQRPLDVPPQLAPVEANDRFAIPQRESALSTIAQGPRTQAQTPVAQAAPSARIERAGSQRWLSVAASPEEAFSVIRDFLPSLGFSLAREDAALGILETQWAENRAKLPQDIIRRTLGRVLDGLYSTGERDQYRVRIERTQDGGAEIFVSHRGMIEVYTNQSQDQTKWQPRPPDPALEAELLQRILLQFLPKDSSQDDTVSANAQPQAQEAVARVIRVDGEPQVEIQEPFARAWRRVGLALDRGGFTVEDRDRTAGVYYVRYLDPEYEARQREKQGLFSKLFGTEKKVEAQQFRVRLYESGQLTRVSVLGAQGQADTSDTAQKIIQQIAQQIQ